MGYLDQELSLGIQGGNCFGNSCNNISSTLEAIEARKMLSMLIQALANIKLRSLSIDNSFQMHYYLVMLNMMELQFAMLLVKDFQRKSKTIISQDLNYTHHQNRYNIFSLVAVRKSKLRKLESKPEEDNEK